MAVPRFSAHENRMSTTNRIPERDAGAHTDWMSMLRIAVSSLNDLLKQQRPNDEELERHLQEIVDLAAHVGMKPDMHRFDHLPD